VDDIYTGTLSFSTEFKFCMNSPFNASSSRAGLHDSTEIKDKLTFCLKFEPKQRIAVLVRLHELERSCLVTAEARQTHAGKVCL